MNIFVVLLTYQVPLERIMEAVPAHRQYLSAYYEQETILFSGMLASQQGGMLVMRAPQKQEVEQLIHNDPFYLQGLASYEILAINVRQSQPWISNWITGGSLS